MKMNCRDNEHFFVLKQKPKGKIQNRSGASKDLLKMLRYDQVPWRSKHLLLTGHIRRLFFVVIGKKENKSVDN